MKILSSRPALLVLVLALSHAAASNAAPQMVRVMRVVDGRTLAVQTTSGESLITLAGVDLRSSDQLAGPRSRSAEFLSTSVGGRWVMIERETMQAPSSSPAFWVFRSPDGLDLSHEVIRRGLALLTKEPCSRAGELLDTEREARSDLSSGWNNNHVSSGHAMTYLGTIDPPRVRRDKNGTLTTRKTPNRTTGTARSPIVVVIERPPSQQ